LRHGCDDVITCGVWQFLRATTAAVVGVYRVMPIPESTSYILGGAFQLMKLVFSERASAKVVSGRRLECNRCPLFNQDFKTCGTPGVLNKWSLPDGCWCFIPLVSQYKSKGCFIREEKDIRSNDYGWIE